MVTFSELPDGFQVWISDYRVGKLVKPGIWPYCFEQGLMHLSSDELKQIAAKIDELNKG